MSNAGLSRTDVAQEHVKMTWQRIIRREIVPTDTNSELPQSGTALRVPEEQPVQVPAIEELRPRSTSTLTGSLTVGEYFKAIKNWEGVVEEVGDKTFFATVRDASNPVDNGNEQLEIEIEDVDEPDRELIVEGGIFYLTIGYNVRRGGQRIKGIQIVFRRMPMWSARDIERAQKQAARYQDLFEGRTID
jgi:hypothetical protein